MSGGLKTHTDLKSAYFWDNSSRLWTLPTDRSGRQCWQLRPMPTLCQTITIEYASCVWSPHSVGQVKKIESVQRRFTKRFLCCCRLQYSERLVKLVVDSLELRRIRFDLIYVYKLLFHMVDADLSALFVANNVDTVTRGHSLKRNDARKYFFSNRVIGPHRVGIVCRSHQTIFHL